MGQRMPATLGRKALWACALALLAAVVVRAEDAQPDPPDDEDAKVKAALDEFRTAYRGDDAAKAKAIEALGTVRHPKVFATLNGVLAGPENESAQRAAARALGAYRDARVAPMLKKAFDAHKRRPAVLEEVIEAIGQGPDAGLTLLLRKYLDSHGTAFDPKTIDLLEPVVEALGKHPDKENVEHLIQYGETLNTTYEANAAMRGRGRGTPPAGIILLDDVQFEKVGRLVKRCRTALQAMTGEDLAAESPDRIFAPYRKWWKLHEKTWQPKAVK